MGQFVSSVLDFSNKYVNKWDFYLTDLSFNEMHLLQKYKSI